jgi:hypothetical protein
MPAAMGRDSFGGVNGSEITGYTKIPLFNASTVNYTTGGVTSSASSLGAYLANEDNNRGRIAEVSFSYNSNLNDGVQHNGVAVLFRKGTVFNNQFYGYAAFLDKLASSNVFQVRLVRYDADSPTTLYTFTKDYAAGAYSFNRTQDTGGTNITLAPGVDYEFMLATNTINSLYAATPHVELRRKSDYHYFVFGPRPYSAGGMANEYTYHGRQTNGLDNKTGFGVGSTYITVKFFDNGPDSWFVQGLKSILINGDINRPYKDSNVSAPNGSGYFWGIYEVGDAASLDQTGMVR